MKRKNLIAIKKVKKKRLLFKNPKIQKFYANFKSIIYKDIKYKSFAVAVSGGSDSLCLAYFSKIYSSEFGNKIHVMIVDHKLRKESHKEALKVKAILKKKKIQSRILSWQKQVPQNNIQKNARNIRYSLISNYCLKKNIKYLITAHHNDDQIENFFIRLLRGSGLTGLSSMSVNTKYSNHLKIIRPFLNLNKTDLKYEYIEDIGSYVGSEIIPNNSMVGWFRGRMEFGPRALGAISILISPKKLENKKKILSTIKKRPEFQPFCPSIPHESMKDYVINDKNSDVPFMILALSGTEKMVEEAPATTFIDKSIRVQDVKSEINPEFHSLISNFGNISGTPVLLNTSFNRSGQSIVHTPEQALYDLEFSELDFLVLENYLVKRN